MHSTDSTGSQRSIVIDIWSKVWEASLYLIFEKSSCKNQFRRTGFLAWKNQFRNWFLQATQAVKIQFEID